jgi:hypothetical protein
MMGLGKQKKDKYLDKREKVNISCLNLKNFQIDSAIVQYHAAALH